MEYLQKCFYKSTYWNEDNLYSNITATSQALLEFPIPNGIKLDISSKATQHLASSFTLSNHRSVNGSLAYLYSSLSLKNATGTKNVSLQDAISGFKIIEPTFLNEYHLLSQYKTFKDTLVYGRMYFPGSALEAMIIKRLSSQTQLLVKCVNNPHIEKNGTLVIYLQKNTPKFLREYIYSTNEALIGLRCLYNFTLKDKKHLHNKQLIPNFDNSVVSLGTEIWYAALTMSPGLSTSFRYSTRSTSTGKPLTMTLSVNPILGHISSTYNVKTSVSSTFCSKYDFNLFSYASNLSLGFELYNFSKRTTPHLFSNHTIPLSDREHETERPSHDMFNNLDNENKIRIGSPTSLTYQTSNNPQNMIINPIQNLDNYYHINPTLLPTTNKESLDDKSTTQNTSINHFSNETVMTAFQNLVNDSDFSSVFKASTSLNDKMVKLLWEGRCKDFLVSTGVKINVNPITNFPEFNRFGITFSYAC